MVSAVNQTSPRVAQYQHGAEGEHGHQPQTIPWTVVDQPTLSEPLKPPPQQQGRKGAKEQGEQHVVDVVAPDHHRRQQDQGREGREGDLVDDPIAACPQVILVAAGGQIAVDVDEHHLAVDGPEFGLAGTGLVLEGEHATYFLASVEGQDAIARPVIPARAAANGPIDRFLQARRILWQRSTAGMAPRRVGVQAPVQEGAGQVDEMELGRGL